MKKQDTLLILEKLLNSNKNEFNKNSVSKINFINSYIKLQEKGDNN